MQVLTIVAALSGLVAAIGFRKSGHGVVVLEKAPELREVGAGIQIPINCARALKELGVFEKILSKAIKPRDITVRSYKSGEALYSLNLDPYTQETYELPSWVSVRFGCAVSSISFSEPAVQLSTGETVTGNLVIGADGPRSVCREALLQKPDPPRPNGRLVYRILIDIAEMRKHPELLSLISPPCVDIWAGPNAHIVCYLLRDHFNIVMFFPGGGTDTMYGPKPVDLNHLRGLIHGWEPRLLRLLEIAQSSLQWSLLETEELESWVHPDGKFVIIGDAAHACLPFMAHGAAMGVESAALLSNPAEVCDLLKMYNSAQLPRTKTVIAHSRLMGDILEMPDGPAQIERDRQLCQDMPKKGFPFPWADPDLQNLLWSYDPRVEADSVLRAYASAHKKGLESTAVDPAQGR